jgi:hypothetical protein
VRTNDSISRLKVEYFLSVVESFLKKNDIGFSLPLKSLWLRQLPTDVTDASVHRMKESLLSGGYIGLIIFTLVMAS